MRRQDLSSHFFTLSKLRFHPARRDTFDFLAQAPPSSSRPSPLRIKSLLPPPHCWPVSSNDLLPRPCRVPRSTGASLSARDIYQHPRWRHNLAWLFAERADDNDDDDDDDELVVAARFLSASKHSPFLPLPRSFRGSYHLHPLDCSFSSSLNPL